MAPPSVPRTSGRRRAPDPVDTGPADPAAAAPAPPGRRAAGPPEPPDGAGVDLVAPTVRTYPNAAVPSTGPPPDDGFVDFAAPTVRTVPAGPSPGATVPQPPSGATAPQPPPGATAPPPPPGATAPPPVPDDPYPRVPGDTYPPVAGGAYPPVAGGGYPPVAGGPYPPVAAGARPPVAYPPAPYPGPPAGPYTPVPPGPNAAYAPAPASVYPPAQTPLQAQTPVPVPVPPPPPGPAAHLAPAPVPLPHPAPTPVPTPRTKSPAKTRTRTLARTRTGARPGAVPSPAGPRPLQERNGRLFGLPLSAVLWAELVLALAAAGAVRGGWVVAPAVTPAVLTLLLLAFRWRRRPLFRWGAVGVRFLARRWTRGLRRPRRAPSAATGASAPGAGAAGDARLDPVRELAPRLELASITLRHGRQLGLAFDGRGWAAAIALGEPDALVVLPSDDVPALPLALLDHVLDIDDIRLSSAQLLAVTTPALSPGPGAGLAATSYRQLNQPPVSADRRQWLVLRVDPGPAQDAISARGGGLLGAERVLKRSVARTVELLDAVGVPARPLDEEGLRAALAACTTSQPAGPAAAPSAATPPGGRRTGEEWAAQRVDDVTHVSWWVMGWPGGENPLETLTRLADSAPAGTAVLSVTVHRTPARGRAADRPAGPSAPSRNAPRAGDTSGDRPGTRLRAVVRLGVGEAADPATAVAAFEEAAVDAGVGLRRLDGEHQPAFVVTLPLGGGRP